MKMNMPNYAKPGITPAAARMANRAGRDLGLDFDLFVLDPWVLGLPDGEKWYILDHDRPDECSALANLLQDLAAKHAPASPGPGQGQLPLFDY